MLFPMADAQDGIKQYLDYLDKEMTIMGILSTFCVAAAALVVDRIGTADKGSMFKTLQSDPSPSVLVGSGFLLCAALCFYLQRSRLAHYYGGICISQASHSAQPYPTETWLVDAYSWARGCVIE
jgi:hypothetical protein